LRDDLASAHSIDDKTTLQITEVEPHEEVAGRRAARLVDFRAAGRILKSLNSAAG
jgi:hypothetical protein